jgi:hypothetical protein
VLCRTELTGLTRKLESFERLLYWFETRSDFLSKNKKHKQRSTFSTFTQRVKWYDIHVELFFCWKINDEVWNISCHISYTLKTHQLNAKFWKTTMCHVMELIVKYSSDWFFEWISHFSLYTSHYSLDCLVEFPDKKLTSQTWTLINAFMLLSKATMWIFRTNKKFFKEKCF